MSNVFDELKWRGQVYDCTEGTEELLTKHKVTVYNGFDPTASSLHVGHLAPMMGLARLQRFGHKPLALAGGGTGMIGDPSGRSSERQLLSNEQIEANLQGIKQQLAGILDFEVKSNPAKIVNNADWLTPMSMMTFLRDVGKNFTVNYMLAKDSVKSRIEREDGISFTEFSYMLLQSYDFLHLFRAENCVLQTGGSDQWGNIVAGTELIRKVESKKAHGLVYPLITKADGSKFGKTASGSVWLDAKLTSPYRFYQFWLNASDEDAITYLKTFTWRTQEEVAEMAHLTETQPERRAAQVQLAQDVTRMIHGETGIAKAEQATQVLFGGDLDGLDIDDIQDIFADVPSSEIAKSSLEGDGIPVVDLLAESSLATSKGDARRSVKGGGIYLNNQRVSDVNQLVAGTQALEGQFFVLRKGKKRYHLVKVVS